MARSGVPFAAALALLAALACTGRAPPHPVPLPVRAEVAKALLPADGSRFTANIEPRLRVDLAWKVGGYVEELAQVRGSDGRMRALQDGDEVRVGQVVARLRDADYRVRLEQARGGVEQAEAAMRAANQDFERATKLRADQAVPQALLDGATAKRDGTQGAVDLARAYLRQAQLAVDDTTLRSPIDGVVLKRLNEVGSLVGPGSGACVLADVSQVKAVLGVPDGALSRFPLGASVPVRVDALGLSTTGLVTRVSPFADPRSRVFDVEVTVPNADGRLKPGMVASASSPVADAGQAVPVVPLAAVRRPPGAVDGYAVYVVEDAPGGPVARLRTVRIGEVRGVGIEILEGVRDGERVIVSGSTLAVDGGPVALIP